MIYKVTIPGQLKGLNELLAGRIFDSRTRGYINPVKRENDRICMDAIRFSKPLGRAKIHNPIVIQYKIYARDRRHDRMNLLSAIDKSFEDALQRCGIIKDDGWDYVLNTCHGFFVDKKSPRVEVTIYEVEG